MHLFKDARGDGGLNQIAAVCWDGFAQARRGFQGAQAGIAAKKISDPIDALYECTNFALGACALYDRQKQVYVFLGHGGLVLGLASVLAKMVALWHGI